MKLDNREYEYALLGCILLDNRVLDEYKVTAKLFTAPLARDVWAQIELARARGASADIREVALSMPDRAAEVAGLTDVPSAANAGFYHAGLVELARRRGVAKLAREMAGLAMSAETSDDIFSHIDAALVEIADVRESGYQHVAAFIPTVLAELQAAQARKGALSGIPTGFPGLNELTCGWQRQTMVVVGARPGAGKTSIALNMASAAIRAGHAVGIFSAEMSSESLVKRILADWGPVEYGKLQSGFFTDVAGIGAALADLADRKLYLNDTPSISLADLVAESRRMRRQDRVEMVMIDYLSLVNNQRADVPRHEQVAEISRTLKGLARELDLPIIVLSQLTREAQGERPKLSQLRDSGAVEQDADMVILLHVLGYVDDKHDRLKINMIVEKNRNGATRDVSMEFRPARMRFVECDEKWESERRSKA